MSLAKVSARGQVVIPKPLREKFNIKPHNMVLFREEDGHLVLNVLPEDPIRAARGLLPSRRPVAEIVEEQRAEESLLEARKLGRGN